MELKTPYYVIHKEELDANFEKLRNAMEKPNAEGESEERGLHPRPLLNGKVSMEQLYYRVLL